MTQILSNAAVGIAIGNGGFFYGDLSAQLLRNRKFSGRPSAEGVSREWQGYGTGGYFQVLEERPYTRHASGEYTPGSYECACQSLQCLAKEGVAGIRQGDIPLPAEGGTAKLRLAVRSLNGDAVVLRLALKARSVEVPTGEGRLFFEQKCGLLCPDWQLIEYPVELPSGGGLGELLIELPGGRGAVLGMVSLLPDNNFRGMKRNSVARLCEAGCKCISWPAGEVANDYHWMDGLLHADMRPALPMSESPSGWEENDFNVDDMAVLAQAIRAELMLCVNPHWMNAPENAAWVDYCNGDPKYSEGGKLRKERGLEAPFAIRWWKLGGSQLLQEFVRSAAGYCDAAEICIEAMTRVDPTIRFAAVAPVVCGKEWLQRMHQGLNGKIHALALAGLQLPEVPMDYTEPQRAVNGMCAQIAATDKIFEQLQQCRREIPREIPLLLDEYRLGMNAGGGIGMALHLCQLYHQLSGMAEKLNLRGIFLGQRLPKEGAGIAALEQLCGVLNRHCDCVEALSFHVGAAQHGLLMSRDVAGKTLIACYNPVANASAGADVRLPGKISECRLLTPEHFAGEAPFLVVPDYPVAVECDVAHLSVPPMSLMLVVCQPT